MNKLIQNVVTFLKAEDGPTAVEYAIMLALIVIVCLASISSVGSGANSAFTKIATKLNTL